MALSMPHRLLLLLAAAGAASAQAETIWSSVIFLLHGEQTPLRASTTPELTPVGAQQMYSQGSLFRYRYLDDSSANLSATVSSLTSYAPIDGLETKALDNAQISALSTDDSYIAAGALAFLQGLYPPQTAVFADGDGGRAAAVLASGSVIDFPLSGYQYPLVQTLSQLDSASPFLQGQTSCTAYQHSISVSSLEQDTDVMQVYNSTLPFYHSLWTSLFQDAYSLPITNFLYAYDLYDYARYQYNHNPQTANALTAGELDTLRLFAYTQQLDLNANLSGSSSSSDISDNRIRGIAGRTLAHQAVSFFHDSLNAGGTSNKLNLLFGSIEPFIAFFALAGLLDSTSASRAVFEDLPGPGAAMVFEMFTPASVDTNGTYPTTEEMQVRFLYRPDTSDNSSLTAYSLFGNGPSQSTMSFVDFASAMRSISVSSLYEWCEICESTSLYCTALSLESSGSDDDSSSSDSGSDSSSDSGTSSGSSSSKKKGGISPAVAGVIGAIVALAVIGIAAVVAALLGSVRLCRVGGGGSAGQKSGGGGGFKGPEKKDGDADVVVSREGARHERLGSWELAGGKGDNTKNATDASDLPATPAAAVARNSRIPWRSQIRNDVDDDSDDLEGLVGAPVKPMEHV